MSHDPARVADTKAWLARVTTDLRAAAHDLRASPPLLADTVFHCQQATEKALKGFLAWHDRPFRKTHDIEEIGGACREVDPSLSDVIDRAVPLTEYAWRFRYPGEPEEPSMEEAQEALALATKVYEAIRARLPAEVWP